jgi:hypothetical protein
VELAQSGDEGSGSTLEELRAQLEEEPLRYYLLANLLTYLLTYSLTNKGGAATVRCEARAHTASTDLLTYSGCVDLLLWLHLLGMRRGLSSPRC